MPRKAGLVRPPFGKETFGTLIRACSDYDLDPPPFAILPAVWDMWCDKCNNGRSLFSYNVCPKHICITDNILRTVYARYARSLIENAALYLDRLTVELAEREHLGHVGFVRYTPRVLALKERVGEVREYAGEIKWPIKNRQKKSEATRELHEQLMMAGSNTFDWFFERMSRVENEFDYTMVALEELILWAAGYVEQWVN